MVIGTFLERTRGAVARQEALLILELLGMQQAVQEVLGGAPTTKVVRVRMRSAGDVAMAIARCRARPVVSDLATDAVWMNRARTPAEAARTAPISRAVRELNLFLETQRQQRRDPGWTCEGEYAPGREAVYLSWDGFRLEEVLLEQGGCRLFDGTYDQTGLPGEPQEWLASPM